MSKVFYQIRHKDTGLFKRKGYNKAWMWDECGDIYATESLANASMLNIIRVSPEYSGKLEIVEYTAFEKDEVNVKRWRKIKKVSIFATVTVDHGD